MTMRKGSIVKFFHNNENLQRVGKILEIVERKNPDTEIYEKMALVKLHYNGMKYVIPYKDISLATKEDKMKDKRNEIYWTKTTPGYNLTNIHWVDQYSPF